MKRVLDRCAICGRFVGWYPINFFCDRHCRNCACRNCPEHVRSDPTLRKDWR